MSDTPVTLFALTEADHLTRIHLKLGLEDVGFDVSETHDTIALLGPAECIAAATTPTIDEVVAPRNASPVAEQR